MTDARSNRPLPDLVTDSQRRMWLALTDEWQAGRGLADAAGISMKGAGTVLLALAQRGLVDRRGEDRRYEYRRPLGAG